MAPSTSRAARRPALRARVPSEGSLPRRVLLILALALMALCAGNAGPGASQEDLEEARRLAGAGRLEAAAAAYRRHLAEDPRSFDAHFELGQVLLSADPRRAREHLAAAAELQPDHAQAHARLAQALILLNDMEDAARELTRARDLDPSQPSTRYNLARLYEGQQKNDAALGEYIAFLNLAPHDPRANAVRQRLALFYENNERLDEALRLYDEILAAEPAQAAALNARADILYRRTRYDEALAGYEAVMALDPSSWSAHANAAFIHRLRGDLGKAALHYRRAIELNPENITSQYFLGAVYADRGEDAPAMEQFERVVAMQPDHPLVHYSIGKLLLKRGDKDGAQREFERHRAIQAAERARSRTASTMGDP